MIEISQVAFSFHLNTRKSSEYSIKDQNTSAWWKSQFASLNSQELPEEGVFYHPNQVWCNTEKQNCSQLIVGVWQGMVRKGDTMENHYAKPTGWLPGFNPEVGKITLNAKEVEDKSLVNRADFTGTPIGFPQCRFYEIRKVKPGMFMVVVYFMDTNTHESIGDSDIDLLCSDEYLQANGNKCEL